VAGGRDDVVFADAGRDKVYGGDGHDVVHVFARRVAARARDGDDDGVQTYRSPGALPPGRVLIVGSGQSGCQIAEELHEAGRDVLLASAACRGRRAGSAAATCSAASRRGRRRRATARRRGRCWLRRS
jgi:NADPH-dependent 2,4-dienoyl-CoA reductase/sulfur reductase-like enzyme